MRSKDAACNTLVTLLALGRASLALRILGAAAMDATGAGVATACGLGAPPLGIYKPRRPQASPLFRLPQSGVREAARGCSAQRSDGSISCRREAVR